MKVVVTGATGNVGTAVLRALLADPDVDQVVGVARRPPIRSLSPAEFVSADVSTDRLEPIFAGADAVVHLAWLIQPGRDESVTRAVNVFGSRRVFDAVVTAGVPSLVYASSVGAYSPGPKDRLVDESWPTGGITSSFYSRHKAAVEDDLDRLAAEQPQLRIVRLRPRPDLPALGRDRDPSTLHRSAAARRAVAVQASPPISPDVPGLRFQAVHSDDVADAYRRAVLSDVNGAFNVAADPVIGTAELSRLLDARPVPIPARIVRGAAAATFALRLQPAEPGWVDMALGVPLMNIERARAELGWSPRLSSMQSIEELVAGLREAAQDQTAPLARATSGPARVRELLTGIGKRP